MQLTHTTIGAAIERNERHLLAITQVLALKDATIERLEAENAKLQAAQDRLNWLTDWDNLGITLVTFQLNDEQGDVFLQAANLLGLCDTELLMALCRDSMELRALKVRAK